MKFYWGKIKIVNGSKSVKWLDKAMTREDMLDFDDTYRHLSKEI